MEENKESGQKETAIFLTPMKICASKPRSALMPVLWEKRLYGTRMRKKSGESTGVSEINGKSVISLTNALEPGVSTDIPISYLDKSKPMSEKVSISSFRELMKQLSAPQIAAHKALRMISCKG